jgi:hypothetical protein
VQGEGVNVSPTDDPLQQLPPGRISAYFVFNGAVLIERVKVLAFAGPVNIADGLVERRADGSVVAVCTRTITDRHAVWVALDQPITTPTQVAIYVTDQVSRVFLVRFYVAGVPR